MTTSNAPDRSPTCRRTVQDRRSDRTPCPAIPPNAECLFYPDCLTRAAREDAPVMPCQNCPRYRPRPATFVDALEVLRLCELALFVVDPDRYRAIFPDE